MDSDDARSLPIDDEAESAEYTPSEVGLHSTTSRFVYENGRTYHSYREGEYWGPNDDRMLAHENIIHHLCLMSMKDRLYLAPIKNPQLILDIGTGRGLWAVDMADKFPDAKVVGVDFSPRPSDIPPNNVEFVMDDATSDWTWPENHFDFIHIRGLFGSIADWPRLYDQILRHLKPGGWLEQMEWSVHQTSDDGTLAPDAVLAEWARDAVEIGRRMGKTFEIAETMSDLIREAGFEQVTTKEYKWPIGTWSKDRLTKKIGFWNLKNWEEGMEGWALALFTRVLGRSKEDVDHRLQQVRLALRDRRQHVYHAVRLVYAQKPLS